MGGHTDAFRQDLVDVFDGEGAVQVAVGLQGQLGLRLFGVPKHLQEVLELAGHAGDLLLGIASDVLEGLQLLFDLMVEQGQLLPVVLQAFPALRLVARLPYAFQDLLKVVFNIVFDAVDLNNVFAQMIVLDVCYLRVLVPLLGQVEEVVCLHLFNDLYQSIVKRRGEFKLVLILLFQPCEAIDVGVVICNTTIAESQNLQYLLVDGLMLILRVIWELVLLADLKSSCSLQTDHLASSRGQLGSTATAVKLLFFALGDHEFCPLGGMVQAVVLGLALGVDIARLGQSLAEVVPSPISVLHSLWADQRLDCLWTSLLVCIRVSIGD